MNNAYEEIYRLPNRKYSDGSPVVIDTAALYKLPSISKIAAQVKLASISEETIIACKIIISAYEVDGKTLINEIPYSYLDLEIHKGDYFGVQIPIILPINTRIIDVKIQSVIFSNRTVWAANKEWFNLPAQQLLKDSYSDPSLASELRYLSNCKYEYYPLVDNNLFICSCGTINKYNEKCSLCGKTYEEILFLIDKDFLNAKRDERLEQERILAEKQEKELQQLREQQAKRNHTVKVISCIVIPILLISIISFNILKTNSEKTAYENGLKAYEDGDLLLASDKFLSANDYKDAEAKWEEIHESLDGIQYYELVLLMCQKTLDDADVCFGTGCTNYGDSKTYENVEIDNLKYDVSVFYDEESNDSIRKIVLTNRSLNVYQSPQLKNDFEKFFGDDYTYSKNNTCYLDDFFTEEGNTETPMFTRFILDWSLSDNQSLRLTYDDDGGLQIVRTYIPSE